MGTSPDERATLQSALSALYRQGRAKHGPSTASSMPTRLVPPPTPGFIALPAPRISRVTRELPTGLTELVLPLDRDDYCYPLTDVTWPAGLQKLTLPFGMDLDGVTLPPGARVVRYRYHVD